MVALTYGDTRVATPDVKTATTTAPRQGFFARLMTAMMEARMRQAEREIRLYAPRFAPLVSLSASKDAPHGGI